MVTVSSLFSQLLQHFPRSEFQQLVKKHQAEYKSKGFSCWTQFLFNQVKIDQEVHTLIWPNGADFDPATLHDWPEQKERLKKLSNRWTVAAT
ncbi:MAG: DUF4372 domain-containing protein [Nitrospinae bacterium]|nr:DUF4372 domain-containing protein [Nitrospinota bacterium]